MINKLIDALSDYFEVGSNCYHYILERVKWAELKTEDFREYDDDDIAELAEFLVENCNLSEQKHGHWMVNNKEATCSSCKFTTFEWVEWVFNYCPNCGAKMIKEN